MMRPWFRETALGQAICFFSSGQYSLQQAATHADVDALETQNQASEGKNSIHCQDALRKDSKNHTLVSWNGPSDPEHPQNWPIQAKIGVTAVLSIYSFVVYCGSAICTMSYSQMAIRYGKSTEVVSLTLALYVLGYGVGPLFWSPLSEMPKLGRNPPYILSFIVFTAISITLGFVDNFAGILVLRFFQGFFGSPCLATAGASIQDIFPQTAVPYNYLVWVEGITCAPAVAPLFASYAVTSDWRWPFWQIVIMSIPVLLALAFLLPETSHSTILVHRAYHLRRQTGNRDLLAPAELQTDHRLRDQLLGSLTKPLEISLKDPAITFVGVYTSFLYAIYYSFFSAFPLLYPVDYRMSAHSLSLTFLAIVVGGLIGGFIYTIYLYATRATRARQPPPEHEYFLIPAIPATALITAGLFMFAGTARSSIHWLVPTAGVSVYATGINITFLPLLLYLPLSYPRYAASLLAANDFMRSATAAVFVMVTPYMYQDLGVRNGAIILASVSTLGIVGMVVLYLYGGKLRARSKFTDA